MTRHKQRNDKISKQSLTEGLLYLLVWGCVFLVPIINASIFRSEPFNWNTIKIVWGVVLPYFLVFLIHNFYLAPRLLLKKRYIWYTLASAATVAVIFGCIDIYQNAMGIGVDDKIDEIARRDDVLLLTNLSMPLNTILGIFMCGLNAGIKMIFKSLRDEQTMEALKRNMLQAELDYLKYQINPHFFMNTLNNIHALIDIDAETAKDTVIELAKMMRYILYNSDQDGISLEQEINFLGHYIRLMRLRYSNSVEIEMRTPEHVPHDIMLPPLVLIVFVENAFKHGISYNGRSFINIGIEVADRRIICTVTNSRNPSQWKKSRGGIGLDNVRKRLDLIYHDRYSLAIDQSEDTYSINLNIPSL